MLDREALVRRRDELQAVVDSARERMNQNAGGVAAFDEVIAMLDEQYQSEGRFSRAPEPAPQGDPETIG